MSWTLFLARKGARVAQESSAELLTGDGVLDRLFQVIVGVAVFVCVPVLILTEGLRRLLSGMFGVPVTSLVAGAVLAALAVVGLVVVAGYRSGRVPPELRTGVTPELAADVAARLRQLSPAPGNAPIRRRGGWVSDADVAAVAGSSDVSAAAGSSDVEPVGVDVQAAARAAAYRRLRATVRAGGSAGVRQYGAG